MTINRRTIVVVAVLLGLFGIGFGVWQLRALSWPTASAVVGECDYEVSPRSSGSSSGDRDRSYYRCDVAWTDAAGVQHTDSVDFDDQPTYQGTVEVRVDGDDAENTSVGSEAALIIASGVFVVLVAIFGPVIGRRIQVLRRGQTSTVE